jgi:uncharacterized membrane protein HdeD (DUF308 family)
MSAARRDAWSSWNFLNTAIGNAENTVDCCQRSSVSRTRRSIVALMDDVGTMAKEWWMLAILGVVSLIAGVLAIAYPDITLLAIGVIFGIYLLLAGIFELVNAIIGDAESRALAAIVGVVGIVAGLVCLRRPGQSLLALVLVLGIYLIVVGVASLVRAIGDSEHRGWALLGALADLVLGILILAVPKVSLATLALLFGLSLIVRGVIACVGAFQLRKLRKGDAPEPGVGAAPA